ncbi:hypothetical protein CAPTEDRAFT_227826 [Capitella teleta]|uniref:Uncharacterized protein n=1 Tax=Capitella teleta TaxID=283909 RepID=R7V8T1_CAPTE|nr:hypothetical protein CAPTEDRAFT_227826 [Capitella teleta]|eukprot:ELU14922.1 hypothetical protein CAPTEDRAFT_227826 [Capitella teleta]
MGLLEQCFEESYPDAFCIGEEKWNHFLGICTVSTIYRLWQGVAETGSRADRLCAGQPKVTPERQDRQIRRAHIQDSGPDCTSEEKVSSSQMRAGFVWIGQTGDRACGEVGKNELSKMESETLNSPPLRLMTYLSPGIPLELYQVYQHYLEEVLQRSTILMVESRCSGPLADRPNPFTTNQVDVGFICSSAFLKEIENKNEYVELMEAAPIHIHPKSELRPIYYSDPIEHPELCVDESYKMNLGHKHFVQIF